MSARHTLGLLVLAAACAVPRASESPPTSSATSSRPTTGEDRPPETSPSQGEAEVGEASSAYAPCAEAPEGMVCIAGGKAVVGSADQPGESPRHEVELSTFYIDRFEVTNAEYDACVATEGCTPRIPPEPSFNRPDQPAVPITWHMAHDYCRWAGKRLPSEAEWEKAARGPEGRRYPWGEEPPDCERAHTVGCEPATTLAVGSLPSGATPLGVHDMAGNGFEWVQDWASSCFDGCDDACGEACLGRDPLGPCAGGKECGETTQRILKGGSWYWPDSHGRGAFRRASKMSTGVHRLSMRCASSAPTLTGWPPRVLVRPYDEPPPLEAPSAAELALARRVAEETDVLNIPPCDEINRSSHDCRDPHSYLLSNEPEQWRYRPFAENVGGGYVGIGADQNYSFIAAAKSRWAWIFDYDPAVVRLHYAIRAAVLAHPSPKTFHEAFEKDNRTDLLERVRLTLKEDFDSGRLPENEMDELRRLLVKAGPYLVHAYREATRPLAGKAGRFGWLRDAERYRTIRVMFQQDRIILRKGNLLTDVALPSIAKAARGLGVPIRILYTSNADDQWELSNVYRDNLASLPFDERSVVLRTTYARRRLAGGKTTWTYTVQSGKDLQRRIHRPELKWLWWLESEGHRAGNLVGIGLPGAPPEERVATR